jgi:hypothetical protein
MTQLSKRSAGSGKAGAGKALSGKAGEDYGVVLGDDWVVIDAKSMQVVSPTAAPVRGGMKVYKVRGSKGGQYYNLVPGTQMPSVVRLNKTVIGEFRGMSGPQYGNVVFARGGPPVDVERVKRVLDITLGTIRQAENLQQPLSESDYLQEVSKALQAEAAQNPAAANPEAGWQELLLRGLEYKRTLLASDLFKSTGEVATILGIGEAAVRRRARESKLFALQLQPHDDYRIPLWSLGIGDSTRALLAVEPDPWALYHFLTTAAGPLNGLRPFELLLPLESLTPHQLSDRSELLQYRKLAARGPCLDLVLETLAADKSEALQAS